MTKSGAAATFILAALIFGLGGIKWSVPIFTFFVLSSLLSKFKKKRNPDVEIYFEKNGVRDFKQVIANGGVGGLLVILNAIYSAELLYLLYLASLSAVCADTWATEIGTMKKNAAYNILNLKPVPQGTSGGISVMGSIGALMGSFTIALSGIRWVDISYIHFVFLILLAGLLGSFFDSVLGATIQRQNKCPVCSKVTERQVHCGIAAGQYKGYLWIDNDMVNLFSGIAGAFSIIILKSFINF